MPAAKNLLFILSDNHNRRFAGAYGHPQASTPHIDRLAAEGVTFDNAYAASPLCCPSRAALATGCYPHQTGLWDNAIVYQGEPASWMRRLRDQGHKVVSVGKLHFRSSEDDNGFSREILPMHILDGKGGVHMLMRGFDEEPVNKGQWELYMERAGIGTAPYQDFDHQITDAATAWLSDEAQGHDKPWVFFVSFPSPHPPFRVPEGFYCLSDEATVDLPSGWRPGERSEHPADRHLRRMMDTGEIRDEAALRRVQTGYLGLIAHLDRQIGTLLATLEETGLADDTRVLYTSDHGDLAGQNGLFGKSCLYEGAIGVPLVISGAESSTGRRAQLTSHVDLFPTIVEAVGGELDPSDANLPGRSLWPAIAGIEQSVPVFSEYHAAGSKAGSFMLRDGDLKLIYHVGMPAQLFDLTADVNEARDLGSTHPEVARLEAMLREICDPEAVDARAKTDQRVWVERWGGREAVTASGALVFTPPPGVAAEIER